MSDKTTEQPFNIVLCEHARFAAQRALDRLGAPLSPANLNLFLADARCLRYPTRIIYDRTGLEPQQVAQPFYRPEIIYLVVAYMAAVINYGDAATPELAEMLGSLLTGIEQEEFYEKMCAIADSLSGVAG